MVLIESLDPELWEIVTAFFTLFCHFSRLKNDSIMMDGFYMSNYIHTPVLIWIYFMII